VGNTTNYAIPYPEQYDIPDGAAQMKAIADGVDQIVKTNADNITVNTNAITALNGKLQALAWTPVVTSLTLGNGSIFGAAYQAGDIVVVSLRIRAAASAPTTAWQSPSSVVNLPRNVKQAATSAAYFASGGGHLGMVIAGVGSNTLMLAAITTSLTTVSPGNASGWGTAVWANSGEFTASVAYVAE
jgi:hypothetical protein